MELAAIPVPAAQNRMSSLVFGGKKCREVIRLPLGFKFVLLQKSAECDNGFLCVGFNDGANQELWACMLACGYKRTQEHDMSCVSLSFHGLLVQFKLHPRCSLDACSCFVNCAIACQDQRNYCWIVQ
jgi:hypothetical protein